MFSDAKLEVKSPFPGPVTEKLPVTYLEYILAHYATVLIEQHLEDPKFSERFRADLRAAASHGYQKIAAFDQLEVRGLDSRS